MDGVCPTWNAVLWDVASLVAPTPATAFEEWEGWNEPKKYTSVGNALNLALYSAFQGAHNGPIKVCASLRCLTWNGLFI